MEDVAARARLREASGSVSYPSSDWLTDLLYGLMRDVAPPGEVEALVRSLEQEPRDGMTHYTNGWLARYANHLANRLRAVADKPPK